MVEKLVENPWACSENGLKMWTNKDIQLMALQHCLIKNNSNMSTTHFYSAHGLSRLTNQKCDVTKLWHWGEKFHIICEARFVLKSRLGLVQWAWHWICQSIRPEIRHVNCVEWRKSLDLMQPVAFARLLKLLLLPPPSTHQLWQFHFLYLSRKCWRQFLTVEWLWSEDWFDD